MVPIRIKSGSRAQIDAAAGDDGLWFAEPYFVSDEDRIAIGLDVDQYVAFVKESELAALQSEVDLNTAKNTYPSADATKIGHISVTQPVDLDAIESELASGVVKTTGTQTIAGNKTFQDDILLGASSKITGDATKPTELSNVYTDFTGYGGKGSPLLIPTAYNRLALFGLKGGTTTVTPSGSISSGNTNYLYDGKNSWLLLHKPNPDPRIIEIDWNEDWSFNRQFLMYFYPNYAPEEFKIRWYDVSDAVLRETHITGWAATDGLYQELSPPYNSYKMQIEFIQSANGNTYDYIHVMELCISNFSEPFLPFQVQKSGDTMLGDLNVPDEAYDDSSWNGSTEVPTKNAVRDVISPIKAKTDQITVTQPVDLDALESNVATNNAKNSYPSADASKLAGIEAGATADQTDAEILAAVESESGRDLSADGTKLDGIETGATADQTAGEIKTAYESNANTNAFTDADVTKLAGIESGADITDATNVNAAGATMNTDTDVSGNSWVVDEDDMTSDLATKVPTQQSVKAFVEASRGHIVTEFTTTSDANPDSSVNRIWVGAGDPVNKVAGDFVFDTT